jgi:A/G-specific adenine glycosylase
MELGALVCLPRAPLCIVCPVVAFCAAAKSGAPEDFPRFAPRPTEKVETARLWLVHAGRLLLFRHGAAARRLSGLHELPEAGVLPKAVLVEPPLAVKRRAISNQQITETIYRGEWTAALARGIEKVPELVWVPLDELATVTLSGPHRKWLAELLPGSIRREN